jgi:hypothetical protein
LAVDWAPAGAVILWQAGSVLYQDWSDEDGWKLGNALSLLCLDVDIKCTIDVRASSSDNSGSGRRAMCLIDANPVFFDGLVLTGGYRQSYGGAISIDRSTATFKNSVFTENEASRNGGAFYVHRSTVTFVSCEFSLNTGEYGPGVMDSRNSVVTMVSCVVMSNTGRENGAIAIWDTTMTVTGCTFSNNVASGTENEGTVSWGDYRGGGLRITTSTVTLTGSEFSSNEAQKGGGLSIESSQVSLNNCAVSENTAVQGGGIFVEGTCGPFLVCESEQAELVVGRGPPKPRPWPAWCPSPPSRPANSE